jgi:hypothetical protein
MATRRLFASRADPSKSFGHLKTWIAGITSVLVVLPALVNAGYDIYASVAKLPKTEAESANQELFKKYFNKQPVAAFPVPVKQNNGTVEVRFSIYEEGDVFVEFGRMTQWFRFPANKSSLPPSALSLFVSSAHAQSPAPAWGAGAYAQTESMDGRLLVRERRYANGVSEKIVLDTRSGVILDKSIVRDPADGIAATHKPIPRALTIPTIDLDLYKRNKLALPSR